MKIFTLFVLTFLIFKLSVEEFSDGIFVGNFVEVNEQSEYFQVYNLCQMQVIHIHNDEAWVEFTLCDPKLPIEDGETSLLYLKDLRKVK